MQVGLGLIPNVGFALLAVFLSIAYCVESAVHGSSLEQAAYFSLLVLFGSERKSKMRSVTQLQWCASVNNSSGFKPSPASF